MKKSFGDYRLLASGRGLWEGPDHLLYIESTGFILAFSESYRRIDYSKIQAVTYGRTRTWGLTLAWQCLLLALSTWGLTAIVQHWNQWDAPTFFGSVTAIGLLGSGVSLIVNLIKGPTCICKLQTAVQVLRLKPVRRVREARRLADRLGELCLIHQGGIVNAEQIASLSQQGSRSPPLYMKAPFTGSALILWGLVLLLAAGGFTTAEVFVDNLVFFLVDVLLALSAGTLITIAMVRSTRFELPGALKGALWGALVNFIFSLVAGFGFYLFASIMVAKASMDTLSRGAPPEIIANNSGLLMMNWLSHASFNELGWSAWLVVAIGGLNIFFALLGLPSALLPRAQAVVSGPPVAEQPGATVIQAATIEPQRPEEP